MSGILGSLGGMLGGGSGASAGGVASVLQTLLTQQGGVQGLAQRFEGSGLGNHVQSWIGNGQNWPVSPQELGQVFSSQEVQGWAAQAGTTPQAILGILSQVLPHAVDQATPDGNAATAAPPQSGWGSLIGKMLG